MCLSRLHFRQLSFARQPERQLNKTTLDRSPRSCARAQRVDGFHAGGSQGGVRARHQSGQTSDNWRQKWSERIEHRGPLLIRADCHDDQRAETGTDHAADEELSGAPAQSPACSRSRERTTASLVSAPSSWMGSVTERFQQNTPCDARCDSRCSSGDARSNLRTDALLRGGEGSKQRRRRYCDAGKPGVSGRNGRGSRR